jgi:hypothetical protein
MKHTSTFSHTIEVNNINEFAIVLDTCCESMRNKNARFVTHDNKRLQHEATAPKDSDPVLLRSVRQ